MQFTKRQARWKEPVIQKAKQGSHVFLVSKSSVILLHHEVDQVAAEVSKMVNRASHQRPIGEANDSMSTEANSYTSTNRETAISLSGIPMSSFARSKISSLKLQVQVIQYT
jgi:hypothetical protein